MKIHPAADSLPMMDEQRYKDLLEDIRANGLRVPVLLWNGEVLDGRNRLKACRELGVEPKFSLSNPDDDPWQLVMSLNVQRRDLVAEQRYLIWKHLNEGSDAWLAEKARIKSEADKKRSKANFGNQNAQKNSSGTECSTTVLGDNATEKKHAEREEKARRSQTNKGAVQRGDLLCERRPDLAEKVRLGEMKPADAHREIKREEHAKKVEAATKSKEEVTESKPTELPDLVLADPPWRYDHQLAGNRDIENHYCTADKSEICGHKPETKDDCILLLWATAPKLIEAIEVMGAWGFDYKTHAVWDKKKVGMGYWFRGQHELLMVGVKGKASPTPEVARVSSVFEEPRREHSKKPDCVYEWIEYAFPQHEKLEMYCRSPRQGWQSWGNEV